MKVAKQSKSQGGCLIGLDLGSSSVKGVLLDLSGNLLAEVSRENCLLTPQDGWGELDPANHLENVCGILRELSMAAPERVLAIAMAAASGNPVTRLCPQAAHDWLAARNRSCSRPIPLRSRPCALDFSQPPFA